MTAEELKTHAAEIETARALLERFKAMEEADVLFTYPNGGNYIHRLTPKTDDPKFDLLPHIRIGIRALSQAVEAEIAELERAVMWSKDAMRNPVEGRYTGLIRENFVPFPKPDVGVDLGQGKDSTAEIQWTTQNLAKTPDALKPINEMTAQSLQRFHDCEEPQRSAIKKRIEPNVVFNRKDGIPMIWLGERAESDWNRLMCYKLDTREWFMYRQNGRYCPHSEYTGDSMHAEWYTDPEPQEKVIAEENGERIVVRREPIPTPPEGSADSGPLAHMGSENVE